MEISVVIPVYNAGRYVETAVHSALQQPETAEVLLVEDDSPDNALEVCRELEAQHSRVRLLRHADGKNHGAGESRNLGIRNASFDYVAFLDADDYYLENRFARAAQILADDPTTDGVYEAVGAEFENDEAERRYFLTHPDRLATITRQIDSHELFRYLIVGGAGYIHLDGLVVKKSGLLEVGMFPEIRLHQDMILCMKLAVMLTLVAGDTRRPVAIRRLHLDNRITNPSTDFTVTRFKAFRELFRWSRGVALSDENRRLVRNAYWSNGYRACRRTKKYHMALYYYLLFHLFGR